MNLTVDDIEALLRERGACQYGQEDVSQLEHALQCAQLAVQAGDDDALVVACLLHDFGHLIAAQRPGAAEPDDSHDDLHEFIALPFLRPLFPDAVLEPIRLHVQAKRYLCRTEPGYLQALSPASVHSLSLQGGPFDDAQARRFIAQSHAAAAIQLRRHDDRAKVAGWAVPGLPTHRHRLLRMLRTAG